MDFYYTVLVDDVARTEFDWKIYHLVQDDIVTTYHAIEAEDGTVKAVCELSWRKI